MKQRLLGAIVLIALAVIFVPMFLSGPGPQQPSETVNLKIPPVPDREFETRVLDTTPPRPATVQTEPAVGGDKLATVDTSTAPPPVTAPPVPAPTQPGMVETPKPAPVAVAPKPASPIPAEVAPGRAAIGQFYVPVGVYAQSKNANDLVAKLKQGGFPAFAEATQWNGAAASRVRVGPFADRAAAESARLKIKQLQPEATGSVMQLAADTSTDAPASALPANRAGGWAVQLGAFGAFEDANALRARAINAGFAAFVDKIEAAGKSLWRVRVGPAADRAAAEAMRSGVKDKLKLDGLIVTQP